jgi:hypothetical protein
VIERCRRQMSFAEGLIAEEVGELWEAWMHQVDQVLADPQLLAIVYETLARRWPKRPPSNNACSHFRPTTKPWPNHSSGNSHVTILPGSSTSSGPTLTR